MTPADTVLTRLAHRSGVTTATSSLHRSNLFKGSQGVICGLSTTFRTGATHALEKGAIVQEISALQVVVSRAYPYSEGASTSVSQTIAGLRRMLQGWEAIETETGFWFKQAVLVSENIHSDNFQAVFTKSVGRELYLSSSKSAAQTSWQPCWYSRMR
jgi:hypothetical protein